MTQPEQVLPPWLTFSRSVITNAAGAVSTSTAVLYLPLTYYGPSIPLGPDWTYGGLTSPAPTSSPAITTTPARPTITITTTARPTITPTTARPTSSSTVSSLPSSSRPTGLATSTSTSGSGSTTTNAPTSSSGVPLPSVTPMVSHLSKPALIGAILGAILGSVVLLLVLLLYVRIRVGRRTRNTSSIGGWSIVDAGDGSPRHSGEEADSFLRRDATRPPPPQTVLPAGSPPTARLVTPPAVRPQSGNGFGSNRGRGVSIASSTFTAASGGVLYPPDHPGSDSSSTGSGYGTLLTSGFIVPPGEILNDEMGYQTRRQYPSSDLERTDEVDEPPEERPKVSPVPEHPDYASELTDNPESYSPPHPPKSVSPDRTVGYALLPTYTHEKPESRSLNSRRSSYPADADEAALLLTAQRVRVRDLGSGGPATSTWQGITNFAKTMLSSLSSRRGSRLTLNSRPNSIAHNGSHNSSERERHRALLSASDEKSELGMMLRVVEGDRPTSKYSEKSGGSGNTAYHSTRSRPETPQLSPLPRAFTPANGGGTPPYSQTAHVRPDGYYGIPSDPPAYDYDENRTRSPLSPFIHSRTSSPGISPGADILDLPVPQRLTQLGSATSLRSGSGSAGPAFPPGLITAIPSPSIWRHTSGSTPSPGSFGVENSSDSEHVCIDLEEAPPAAGEGWRDLARLLASDRNRRTTFGVPNIVHGHHPSASEVASIHSHLDQTSHRSMNSGGDSSYHAFQSSLGSSSSLPSAQSHGRSGRSAASVGSVSSDGRLRIRGAVSPSLSAFRERLSPTPSPLGAEAVPSLTSETSMDTTTGTLQTDGTTDLTSPGTHFLNSPWAAGLGNDWNPS